MVIITAITVDTKDGEFIFYAEYANIQPGGVTGGNGESGGGDKYLTLIGRGKNFPEARLNLEHQTREQFFNGTRVLIMTERLAKDHITEYINRFRADEEYRKKIIIAISKEEPEKMYKTIQGNGDSVGFKIDDMYNYLHENGMTFEEPTTELMEDISAKQIGVLLPAFELDDEEISLTGYYPVKDTIGEFIPIEKARGILYLKADKATYNYVVPYKDINFTIKIVVEKRKMTPVFQNGKISFKVNCDINAELLYGDKKVPYDFDENVNNDVSESLREMIKKDIDAAFWQAQNLCKCDYLGCYERFRVHYPKEIEKLDWEKEFPKANHYVEVKVKLESTPMIDYSIQSTK